MKKSRITYHFALLILTLFATLKGFSSHLVGGEIYYKLLDSNTNKYKVSLQLFFDCENGSTTAINSERELSISQWDAVTKSFLGDFKIEIKDSLELSGSSVYKCVNQPSDVCILSNTYEIEVVINPGQNGVLLAWQRCCRTMNLENVLDPSNTGFTAWTKIPPKSIKNSSPVFSDLPPVFVCFNAPSDITQIATDGDGDSLAYRLVTPFKGATRTLGQPQSFAEYDKPPFKNIQWASRYNSFQPMIGSPSLILDERTGKLTITPTEKGVFVISIQVDEFREGVLIGETRRDYQINVIDCQFKTLSYFSVKNGSIVNGSEQIACNTLVNFENQSKTQSSTGTRFFWDFGDPKSTSDTQTTLDSEVDPQYEYLEDGEYTVTLIVNSQGCIDTFFSEIKVRSNVPFDLGPDTIFCKKFNHKIKVDLSEIDAIVWSTGATSREIQTSDTGLFHVQVTHNGCVYNDSIKLKLDSIEKGLLPRDTLLCKRQEVILDVGLSNLKYQWNSSGSDTFQTYRIKGEGKYWVVLSNENCHVRRDIDVSLFEKTELRDTLYCTDFIHEIDLQNFKNKGYEFLWNDGRTNSSKIFTQSGEYWVELNQKHCLQVDTFSIERPDNPLRLGSDSVICDSINLILDAGDGLVEYLWNTGEVTKSIFARTAEKYSVKVKDSNGCIFSDSVIFNLVHSPVFSLGNDTSICVKSEVSLSGPAGYRYYWNTGELDSQIIVSAEGTYILNITDENGCQSGDSVEVFFNPNAIANEIYIPNSFTPNGDGLNDLFPYKEAVVQSNYSIIIFSRWGERIFDSAESESPNWSGYYDSKKVTQGVYFYVVRYLGCDGNFRNVSGTVNVLY